MTETNTETFKLPDDCRASVEKWFKDATSDLIFRRVHNVSCKPEDLVDSEIVGVDERGETTKECVRGSPDLPPQQHRDLVTEYYSHYLAWTRKDALRTNDPCDGNAIFFTAKDCGFFDSRDLKLNQRIGRKTHAPLPHLWRADDPGDIIAGWVERGDKGWKYLRWFICSEAFLNLWTLIMYPSHPSFPRPPRKGKNPKPPSEDELRHAIISSGWLISNPFKQLRDSMIDVQFNGGASDHGSIFTPEMIVQLQSRVRGLRCEKTAKSNCHTYVALAMMIRWGELPTEGNIPSTDAAKVSAWDLPPAPTDHSETWLMHVLQKYARYT